MTVSTIPGLLLAAAERDPDGVWIRTDDGDAVVRRDAPARSRASRPACATEGIGQGDLVVVTARTTPPYLLAWLALASIGAVTVPTDPAATEQERAGLIGQVQPRALISDCRRSRRPRP